MPHTNFQTSEPSGSEEGFLIFSRYFYGSNLGPYGPGPSWTLGPSFQQTG